MVEKIPAPMTAAIPIRVRSLTFSTRFKWESFSASENPASLSFIIKAMDFLRKKFFDIIAFVVLVDSIPVSCKDKHNKKWCIRNTQGNDGESPDCTKGLVLFY